MRDDDFSPFRLTAKEARLLAHLMKASPRAASRPELTESVYAGGVAPRTDRIPSLVCALRKKLAAHGVAIETKRGKGYRLTDSPRASRNPSPHIPLRSPQGANSHPGETLHPAYGGVAGKLIGRLVGGL
jgi:DNA-binding winged helix-turn-helix (wHTH) protein